MKNVFVVTMLVILTFGCSGSNDTTEMNAEDHLAYAMELYNNEDYQFSIKEFQSIILQFPGNVVNDDAQYYLAMSYFNDDQYLLAAYEFSKLIRDIKGSEFVAKSQFMLADSYYQLSPPYQLEQSYTLKAISEFQAFLDFFPVDAKSEEAERKIHELNIKLAEKLFESAQIYEKMEYYNASLEYYTKVYETYHDTKYAPIALHKKITILLEKERIGLAVENMKLFLTKYPESEFTTEIQNLYDEMSN
ncbi:MAG: outer membrane protein assembly factor BamD [Bacteroidetes bacterium]|nr:outer membrane protein assembly factor BamD [Bacteroidota bacterium]MBU1116685.1 outer membrane protein assembly factor BamD [Bacteroidota bacterium]MBU1800050.1 outer membrane protein assembly factor BamD [Bacteroidota bacterium]